MNCTTKKQDVSNVVKKKNTESVIKKKTEKRYRSSSVNNSDDSEN